MGIHGARTRAPPGGGGGGFAPELGMRSAELGLLIRQLVVQGREVRLCDLKLPLEGHAQLNLRGHLEPGDGAAEMCDNARA